MIELLQNYDPLWDTLDIIVVAFIIYRVLLMVRGTRSVQTLIGFGVLFGGFLLIELAELTTSTWVLNNIFRELPLIVVILFRDEIRVALERLGRGGWAYASGVDDGQYMIEETVRAVTDLTSRKTGALIVFERKVGLADLAERAVEIDGRLRAPMLVGLFQHSHPLHDGAVLIRNGRIALAAAVLPLSDHNVPSYFGTRHRAALGISEVSDAVVICCSEERGQVTLFIDGVYIERVSADDLRMRLYELLGVVKRSQ